MMNELKQRLAELAGFDVKADFYTTSAATAAKVIFIEPHESLAEIKSGQNPQYPETMTVRVVVGISSKANPNAAQELIDAVRSVRSKFWVSERMNDKVAWLKSLSFKESETCKFLAPNANETKALAVLTLEIKTLVAI